MKTLTTTICSLAAITLTPLVLAGGETHTWFELDTVPSAPKTTFDDWSVSYKDGLKVSNSDGSTSIKIGGRLMYDLGWQTGEDKAVGEQVEFRRARLYVKGQLNGNVSYKVNYDFARSAGPVSFKDMYVQFDDLQAIRVGRFKEYNSIDNLTSSKYITMIEPAGIVNAISPDRNSGAGKLWEINENTTAALGLFKETSNGFSDNSGEWSVTGRLTHLLADTLHLGASASARGGSDTDVSTRPGHHMDGRITLSDDGRAEDSSLYGLETAWLNGPFSLQAEYISQSFDSANEAEVSGYYVMASWFTTGEHRPYNKSIGAFSRVVPSGDGGAYELTARMDHSAGEDTDRVEVDDLIVGINWYTGRNSRIMLNYVMADINEGGTKTDYDALLLRFQVDF